MKVSSISLSNVKSFRSTEKIEFNEENNILIGPNGGGKSNLLDSLTVVLNHYFLYSYSENRQRQETNIQRQQNFRNPGEILEKHIGEDRRESRIKISLKATREDINNITSIQENIDDIERITNNYTNVDRNVRSIVSNIRNWDLENISSGNEFYYEIMNYNIASPQNTDDAYTQYLRILNYVILIAEEIEDINLQPVYFYFSPYRGNSNDSMNVTLQSDNYYQQLHNYLGSTSRQQTSAIDLALFKFADMMRMFDHHDDTEAFWDEEEVQLVTDYIGKLGYEWDLECTNIRTNRYEFQIKKGGQEYQIDQLSSGENEIFNFLFGILAVNVRNGIIVIDEPELHLHPRWQSVLLELLEELQDLTGNQFIFTTHSPSFITESSIPDVIRLHQDNTKSSRATSISDGELDEGDNSELPEDVDLVHIINSYNNEKMFFADAVILVEGISDRIVCQSIVDYYSNEMDDPRTIEVLEVEGRGQLSKYRDFLQSIQIPNYIIADQDYANKIGTDDVKNLFVTDEAKVGKQVLADDTSRDAETLASMMDDAIKSGNIERLEEIREFWRYIRGRKTRFKESLSEEERQTWYDFLHECQEDQTYILPFGDLEAHLPHSGKDMGKVLTLTQSNNMADWIEDTDSKESLALQFIIGNILMNGGPTK